MAGRFSSNPIRQAFGVHTASSKPSADNAVRCVAAVARMVGERIGQAICQRYVELALARADLSNVTMLAMDETSSRRGHNTNLCRRCRGAQSGFGYPKAAMPIQSPNSASS